MCVLPHKILSCKRNSQVLHFEEENSPEKVFQLLFQLFPLRVLLIQVQEWAGLGAVRVGCVFVLVIYVSSAVVVLFLFLAQKVNLTVSFVVLVQ